MPALEPDRTVQADIPSLVKRVKIPSSLAPSGLAQTISQDPFSGSAKYGLGWFYFCLILLVFTIVMRLYHLWTDKIRTALRKEEGLYSTESSPDYDYEMSNLDTNNTANKLFPRNGEKPSRSSNKNQSSVSSIRSFNVLMALFRFVFYRPVPVLRYKKRQLVFPSLAVIILVSSAVVFVTLYSFLPQPLYWSSMQFGSPPLAIRAGMLSVSMMPWIIALSMKANFITFVTGLGHERLNVLHRWLAYISMFLALVHTVPFYVQSMSDPNGFQAFKSYFSGGGYIYRTGIAALVPLLWLCVFSLPIIRHKAYELFVALHVPVSVVFIAMLFWHCKNFLSSWNYLWATIAIWLLSYLYRLFKLNWTNPWKLSWLIGDECAIALQGETAIKVTIPTEMRWRPGQYVYLRMPGISIFENHPFTIASLWSEEFSSEYGEIYHDMTLVFRPFGGFTRKVLNTALDKGPFATYRAFIDGPYGGMNRWLEAFDNVVLIAGGSGVTALVSQLLELVKRMRDGKAVTKRVQVVWAIKRLETMEWFKEELRICRENAPPDSVHCQFFVTAAKRGGEPIVPGSAPRPISGLFHDKLEEFAQGVASKRSSAYIRDEAAGDIDREKELRHENTDTVAALPRPSTAHTRSARPISMSFEQLQPPPPAHQKRRPSLSLNTTGISNFPPPPPGAPQTLQVPGDTIERAPAQGQFDFGFPSTPTVFQKNLMRFAFGPRVKKNEGWTVEYGRPDVPYMLREFSESFGKRTCVFVCGPPSMRVDVQRTVASLQRDVWSDATKDEIFMHTENYAI